MEKFQNKKAFLEALDLFNKGFEFESFAPFCEGEEGERTGRFSCWTSEGFTLAHRKATWAFHNLETDLWRGACELLLCKLTELARENDRRANELAMEFHYC